MIKLEEKFPTRYGLKHRRWNCHQKWEKGVRFEKNRMISHVTHFTFTFQLRVKRGYAIFIRKIDEFLKYQGKTDLFDKMGEHIRNNTICLFSKAPKITYVLNIDEIRLIDKANFIVRECSLGAVRLLPKFHRIFRTESYLGLFSPILLRREI